MTKACGILTGGFLGTGFSTLTLLSGRNFVGKLSGFNLTFRPAPVNGDVCVSQFINQHKCDALSNIIDTR